MNINFYLMAIQHYGLSPDGIMSDYDHGLIWAQKVALCCFWDYQVDPVADIIRAATGLEFA